jgi:hypothetical protein
MISTHHLLWVKFPNNFSTLPTNTSSYIPLVLDMITLAIQFTKPIQELPAFQIKTLRRRLLKSSRPRLVQRLQWVYGALYNENPLPHYRSLSFSDEPHRCRWFFLRVKGMTSITVWYFELVVGKGTVGDFSVSYFHYIARPSRDITSFFSSENLSHCCSRSY